MAYTLFYALTLAVFAIMLMCCTQSKVGRYSEALRFANLQLEPVSRGGTPDKRFAVVIALACKGRVLGKLGRHADALEAFQAAIATSKESWPMMQAVAHRELAQYEHAPPGVAAKAQADMQATLATFKGLTAQEFENVNFGP